MNDNVIISMTVGFFVASVSLLAYCCNRINFSEKRQKNIKTFEINENNVPIATVCVVKNDIK
jgi:hypothetical protein